MVLISTSFNHKRKRISKGFDQRSRKKRGRRKTLDDDSDEGDVTNLPFRARYLMHPLECQKSLQDVRTGVDEKSLRSSLRIFKGSKAVEVDLIAVGYYMEDGSISRA
jgi:hypothetical protein